ncbi:MAG TPA: hypothetical protein EYP10_07510, partial [Armatimonadetes bacterium]|nr:hypothetical protein [Armatimonadota bacterium]
AQRLIQSLGDNEYMVDARLSIRQVEKLLDIELPEEEYDTLAEMVFEILQRFPRVGDKLTVGDVEVEVMQMQRRRIRWLKLRLLQRDVKDANAIGSPDANRSEANKRHGNAH